MALLIDGYNLLHATGLFGRGEPSSLQASRQALLGFLAAAIDKTERAATIVVFDAAHAPPGLQSIHSIAGITVHFAQEHASADELLEELIAADHSPKKLTVVSSDHRLQRAAKKRRATAIDSHIWYGEIATRLKSRRGKRYVDLPDTKPDQPLSSSEVQAWLRIFGQDNSTADARRMDLSSDNPSAPSPSERIVAEKSVPRKKRTAAPTAAKRPRKKATAPRLKKTSSKKIPNLGFGDVENPFPPGYGEDVV